MTNYRNKIEIKLIGLVVLLFSQSVGAQFYILSINQYETHLLDLSKCFSIDVPFFSYSYDYLVADVDDPDDCTSNHHYASHDFNLSGSIECAAKCCILFNKKQILPGFNKFITITSSSDLSPPSILI